MKPSAADGQTERDRRNFVTQMTRSMGTAIYSKRSVGSSAYGRTGGNDTAFTRTGLAPQMEEQGTDNMTVLVKQLNTEERQMRSCEPARQSKARQRAAKEKLMRLLSQERGRVCELRMKVKLLRKENALLWSSVLGQ